MDDERENVVMGIFEKDSLKLCISLPIFRSGNPLPSYSRIPI